MNSKLKVLLSVVAMSFVMVGCGSSGSSGSSSTPPAPILDNSALADGASDYGYGYYGTQVMFGDNLMTGEWTLDLEVRDSVFTYEFTADGLQIIVGGLLDGASSPYGVSQDGSQYTSLQDNNVRIVNKLGGNCYQVESYDRFDGSLHSGGTFCKK